MNELLKPQPPPTPGGESVWPLVIADVESRWRHYEAWELLVADMRARNDQGIAKYGTPLQTGNGRDSLVDAFQESLDCCAYLRQHNLETGEDHTAYNEALHLAISLREVLFRRDGK